jgi:2-hydroxy-3-keto-5-methylthiopentenyl-1-phosphate phosphatase
MKTKLLTELSEEQQEIITGGDSFSDLANEAAKECDNAKKLIADLIFNELPSEFATTFDDTNNASNLDDRKSVN